MGGGGGGWERNGERDEGGDDMGVVGDNTGQGTLGRSSNAVVQGK